MKRVALTQRVEVLADRNETRDALDQRWCTLLADLGGLALPLPNRQADVGGWLTAFGIDAVILTGGNDLQAAPGARAPSHERDAVEIALLDHCHRSGIPVLGVCRGMQMINHWRGGRLSAVQGHVACRHDLHLLSRHRAWPDAMQVNSYHDIAIGLSDLGDGLEPLALAQDGTVEAMRLKNRPCHGIMWHPEREVPFAAHDLGFIADVLELRR